MTKLITIKVFIYVEPATLLFIFSCITDEKMHQYTLKMKDLRLDFTIFEFPIPKLVQILMLRSIGPIFLIFIISSHTQLMRNDVITPASGQYSFWIRAKN